MKILSVIILVFLLVFCSYAQYNPVDANAVLVLRADRGLTLTTGDSVSDWKDQTTNNIDFSAVATARPIYNSDYPRIEFDGTNDQLISTDQTWLDVAADGVFSMEIHYYTPNSGTRTDLVSKYEDGNEFVQFYQTADRWVAYLIGGANDTIMFRTPSGGSVQDGNWITVSYVLDVRGTGAENPTTNAHIYIDGVRQTTEMVYNSATAIDAIGANVEIPQDFNGEHFAAIRYSDIARSAAEVLAFHNWCVAAFGDTVTAQTYYVDATNGSDNNTGLSTDDAWETIAKVNSFSFDPSDNIYLKRGETWNETLTVLSSGTSGNVITFGAYGSGANPSVDQINVNNKNYISISNCITATNGIINTGTGYLLFGSCEGYENRFPRWPDWVKWPRH